MNKPTRRVRGNSQPPADDGLPDASDLSYWLPGEDTKPTPADDAFDFLIVIAIVAIVAVSLSFIVWGRLG